MSWGVSTTASTNPISLLLAAPPDRAGPLVAAFSADPRFRVLATATSAADARYKLALHPDALLVLAQVFPDFDALAAALSGYEGAVFVILPADTPPSVTAAVSELPPVQQVLAGEVNLPELAGRIYETLAAQQRLHRVSAASNLLQQNGHRAAMVGWRCIAVWSLQGGVEEHPVRVPGPGGGGAAAAHPADGPGRARRPAPAPGLQAARAQSAGLARQPHARGPAPGRAPV